MFFLIEASDVPYSKRQWFIDETTMKQWRITVEEKATFTYSKAEFKAIQLRLLISNQRFQ